MDEDTFLREIKGEKTEDGKETKPGYLVEYPNYQSWSPLEVFEEAYRLVSHGEIKLINQDNAKTWANTNTKEK